MIKKKNRIIATLICVSIFLLNIKTTNSKIYIAPTKAPGINVESNELCQIDYSNIGDGYVVAKYKKSTNKTLKVLIENEDNQYKYTIKPKKNNVLPLSEGDGKYKITMYRCVTGNEYITLLSLEVDVKLKNQFAPFLRPNQYVDYKKSTKFVKKASSLTKKCKGDLAKLKKIYKYVVKKLKYDNKKARTVQKGYLPNLNTIYKKKKGICFDYAAAMTAMLRSQKVPTKLVIGYTGKQYHAWINVYSKKKGWISGAIYISGKKWKLMDPTYASTGKSSKSIMKYIENKKNYKAKYSY